MHNFHKQKGFSLVEILVAVSIFTVASIAITLFARDIFFFNNALQGGFSLEQEGRKVLQPIVGEIRAASISSLGSYPIESAGTSSIVFFSDTDGDGIKERVRYFLLDRVIYRGQIKPTGSPLVYSGINEIVTTLVSDVENSALTPVFSYYDTNYAGTSSSLTMPVNILNIRMVKISFLIDKNGSKLPAPTTVSTQVSFRNLKDNL